MLSLRDSAHTVVAISRIFRFLRLTGELPHQESGLVRNDSRLIVYKSRLTTARRDGMIGSRWRDVRAV